MTYVYILSESDDRGRYLVAAYYDLPTAKEAAFRRYDVMPVRFGGCWKHRIGDEGFAWIHRLRVKEKP